jgi:hypothetical protein
MDLFQLDLILYRTQPPERRPPVEAKESDTDVPVVEQRRR